MPDSLSEHIPYSLKEQSVFSDLCRGYPLALICQRAQISRSTFYRYQQKYYSQSQATELHQLVAWHFDENVFPEGIKEHLHSHYLLQLFNETGQNIIYSLSLGYSKAQVLAFLSISPATYQGYLAEYRLYFQLKELYRIVLLCRWLQLFPQMY